ncbi:MAG: septum formation initiator family protein [Eggerthellaceae bacterium]|nr:septum formation initiator family protein [Eggerthellaceae bacterium]
MTRQANNIVSFDEARRAGSARRSAAPYGQDRFAASGYDRPAAPRRAVYDERAYREDLRREKARPKNERTAASRATATRTAAERASRGRQSESDDQSFETFFGKMNDRAQKAKRQAAKSRADREFTKHYATDHAASPADSGPRAAVYKGEMGSQHKRASRMQNEAAARSGAVSFAAPNLSSIRRIGGRAAGSLILLACCFACCLFLYSPAQQYYQEMRDRDRLAVEYAAVAERNASIERQVARLSTPEGIQDRAREEFGWISEGEYAVSVVGLSSQDEPADFQANINSASIKAPETWYSDVLDAFFGYE